MPKNPKDGVKYLRKGTAEECMKKGFGAGMMNEKTKNLPSSSLQKIKYIGETHEDNFKSKRIGTTTALLNFAKSHSENEVKELLSKVLKKKGGAGLDGRAYNSVIMWLYGKGVKDVPECKALRM
jgi:hypothetical protein